MNNVLKLNLVQRLSRLKMYNILPIQSLLYVREFWTIKQIDVRRLKTAEMKFMGHTAGYSLLDHRRNEGNFKT